MTNYGVILKAFDLILEHKLWEDKSPSEVLRILMYLYSKEWLYIPTIDGKVQAVIGAYRVNYVNENSLNKLPLIETGDSLYVPFALNLTDKSLFKTIRQSLSIYLANNPDVKEIIYEELATSKLKRHKIGARHGKQKRARTTAHTNVSN